MIDYPSIDYEYNKVLGKTCLIQEKIDGHNVRAEYSKGEFQKFGSRHQLIDHNSGDRVFAAAVKLFHEKYAESAKRAFKKLRIGKGIIFGEVYGFNCHIARLDYGVDMEWTFFDLLDIDRKQFIEARECIDTFTSVGVPTPKFEINVVDNNLINQIREDLTPNKEGVVFKPQKIRKPSLKLPYAKAKTAWFMKQIGEV